MKRTLGVFAMAATMACGPASAWDSKIGNPTHPTHSYLTEWAITHVRHAEVTQFAAALIDGANAEMHELPIKGSMYGFDLEKLRLAHKGTNAGTDDIAGWWQASLSAYQAGKKQQAYFLVGIMLHMVEDMGVPAHANGVYHQGTLREFDNFEFLALSNWKPDFAAVNKTDPAYADPSAYYAFSQAWTHEDAPDYHDRNSFSKTWITASAAERTLLRNREGRSATVARWTLDSAYRTFHGG